MVKRFVVHFPLPEIKESPDGGWVTLSEYAALERAHKDMAIAQAKTEAAHLIEIAKLKDALELGAAASATLRNESVAKNERIEKLEAAMRRALAHGSAKCQNCLDVAAILGALELGDGR
jgi:hypothetical protein